MQCRWIWAGVFVWGLSMQAGAQIIVDHACTDLGAIPRQAIEQAKADLRIAYGHTSHGSQLTDGMVGLQTFGGAPYDPSFYAVDLTGNPSPDVLSVHDYYGWFPGDSAADLGNPNFTAWATATRTYLENPGNAAVNVVIWSWCGQLSRADTDDVDLYLAQMSALEADFPGVDFVYMTGHLDIWSYETLMRNNQRIRDYCTANGKTLYDFADIESYDPDGTHYPYASDDCSYYDGYEEPTDLGNWASAWQDSHTEGVDWYDCGAAHSQPLNANQKAYAAWWLWARLAGWAGGDDVPEGELPLLWAPVLGMLGGLGAWRAGVHNKKRPGRGWSCG